MKSKGSRKLLNYRGRRNLMGYFFCAPFILGFVLLFATAFAKSFGFSFNEVITDMNGYSLEYKGLEYYHYALFVDPEFVRAIVGSISGLAKDLIIILIYSLFIAVLLNNPMPGKTLFRAIFFLPVITTIGVIATLELRDSMTQAAMDTTSQSVSMLTGAEDLDLFSYIESLLSAIKISPSMTNVIFEAVNGIYHIITHSGIQIIIFFAGLQSISPSIYEAAMVEGCGRWEQFWKITLPLVSPLIMVNVVWTVVDYFINPTNEVMQKISSRFGSGEYSLSSAMSFINFAVMGVFVAVLLFVVNKFIFYENK
ncbi:MAG: sugar ABC transporter permease [Oscillospiraceae bacterium]|jgi:ABC-type sugar transport system permease subunit|nr:sugar ABC transporter permease [Oscillospiraceae bacterium]